MRHYVFDLDDTMVLHHGSINYHWVYPDRGLTELLVTCSERGTCHLYTNGTLGHARILLEKMELIQLFENVPGDNHRIYAREFHGLKPSIRSFNLVEDRICHKGNNEEDCQILFFDDLGENLQVAKYNYGWATVWITPYHESASLYPYVDGAFGTLTDALTKIHKIL